MTASTPETNLAAAEPFALADPAHEQLRLRLRARYGGSSTGMCTLFARAFADAFPELRKVAGFYTPTSGWGRTEHWWLIDAQGHRVDPTADQFHDQGAGRYEVYHPAKHKTAKGTCMGCGRTLYAREGIGCCSFECSQAVADDNGMTLPAHAATLQYEDDFDDAQTDAELLARGCNFKGLQSLLEMSWQHYEGQAQPSREPQLEAA